MKSIITIITACFLSITAFAEITQVRVINNLDEPLYAHPGAFAESTKIAPGQWKIFAYPFNAIDPQTNKAIKTSKLVVTGGGSWAIDGQGETALKGADTTLCIDYDNNDLKNLTGNRKWDIDKRGVDKGCGLKAYMQAWATKQ